MRCELIGDGVDDWWTIERLEHDGREWYVYIGADSDMLRFMCSARPSDACIEGTAKEMLEIASAIKKGTSADFKRCAAIRVGDTYLLSSPRNSEVPAELTLEEAHELAADIYTKLSSTKENS